MYKHKYIKYKKKYLNVKENQFGGGKKHIYIMRHGQTDWNVEKRLQGCEADIELNETGKNQALITGKYLNEYQQTNKKFDAIFCSPLKRTIETSKIIAHELLFDTEKINIIDDLRDERLGKLSGTTPKERSLNPEFNQLNELLDKFMNIKDPIEKQKNMIYYVNQIAKIYGRETFDELSKRIHNVLDYITKSEYDKILIVTHNAWVNNMFMVIGKTYDYNDGDVSNGKNCKMGYIEYTNSEFKIITNPNTSHFNLYK